MEKPEIRMKSYMVGSGLKPDLRRIFERGDYWFPKRVYGVGGWGHWYLEGSLFRLFQFPTEPDSMSPVTAARAEGCGDSSSSAIPFPPAPGSSA